jgi:hypothetical protein
MNILFRSYFRKNISRINVSESLFWSGSGFGSGHFQKLNPDPVKNRPHPQHHYTVIKLGADLGLVPA